MTSSFTTNAIEVACTERNEQANEELRALVRMFFIDLKESYAIIASQIIDSQKPKLRY